MKILYIDPVVGECKTQQKLAEYLQNYKAENTELDIVGLKVGDQNTLNIAIIQP